MKQVVFISGGCAYTDYDDYLGNLRTQEIDPFKESPIRWNKKLAEDLNNTVELFRLEMPSKYNAKYEEWSIWFERHFTFLHDGVTLVGYSLGAMFLLKYLTENDWQFANTSLILIAPPVFPLRDEETGEDGGDFNFDAKNLSEIKNKAQNIVILHSKDDFVVPFNHGEQLHKAIPGSEFIAFEDKNHFLIEEFPELIELIKETG